jgi:streptogramin lyase
MSVNFSIGSDNYRLDVFPLPAVTDTNPMPLDLVVIGGKVWLGCEFDRRIYSISTSAVDGTVMDAVDIPTTGTPFWTGVFGGQPSAMAQCEDIDADAQGNIWLTQRGQCPYAGDEPNLSRLLRYTPTTGKWREWPLPGNNMGACALLVDGTRTWVTTSEPAIGSALCVTRPQSWKGAVERFDDDEFGGWRVIPHTPAFAAHMALGTDGRLYVADYFGNSVTAYNRTTLAAQTYPLPSGSERPWQIFFDLGGGCWVTCDSTRQLAKLTPSTGAWTVYPLGLPTTDGLHSAALVSGAVWFTSYAPGGTGGRIGRRTSAGAIELSPELSGLGFPMGASGIAASGSDIWVALFGSKAIGRLTRL